MIYLVGMGPGDLRYVTQEAVEVIKNCDEVIAFGRIAKTAEKIKNPVTRIDRATDISGCIKEDRTTAILASGDPGFYGILEYLQRQGIGIDNVIPGITSFQYMMARLRKSWQNACFISLHGREEDMDRAIESPLSVILTDDCHSPRYISLKLRDRGCRGIIHAGFNLSYDNERIISGKIGEEIEDISSLSLVVIENEMD